MGVCITIIILLALATIYFMDKHSLQKSLKDRVAWCVTIDDNRKRCNMPLLNYLNNIDHLYNVTVESQYKIVAKEEQDIAEFILKHFQSELAQAYFNDQLCTNRKSINPNYYLEDVAYFFISLSKFLNKHECERDFYNREMYITKSYKSYGSWGAVLFDATYELTNFAVVYHKLYFLAELFCEARGWTPHSETERIKECLETKEIKVSRF